MILILEGNDKAGKTTIANLLTKEEEFKRVHIIPPTTQDYGAEFLTILTDALMTEIESEHPADIVFDRAHLAELVYGPIDRGETRMTWGQMARIESIFQTAVTILVWVDTEPFVCWSRAFGTDDDAPLQRFVDIHNAYQRAYELSSLPKIRLTDVDSIRKILKWFQS